MIVIEEHTSQNCPKCDYQIDDDDGVNFDKHAGDITCSGCNTVFEFAKNFKYSENNPYTKIEWVSTILIEKGN